MPDRNIGPSGFYRSAYDNTPDQYKELSTLTDKQEKDLTMETKPDTVDTTLEQRGSRYGPFSGHAEITMKLMRQMQCGRQWDYLNDSQQEALHMIAHKIGRILNGDPNYADSWHDIAGYATLVDNQLNGKDI